MFKKAAKSVTTSAADNSATIATFPTSSTAASSAVVATSVAVATSATVATSAAVATSAPVATSATVDTSAAVATFGAVSIPAAVAAAPIKIITDEVIRPASLPDGNILRGLLTKDTSSTGEEEKVNLLDGLGDDFFNEPMDEQTIALIIGEITPTENAPNYNELVENNLTATELHEENEIDETIIDQPQTLTSFISSPGTLPSPISGGKRKKNGGGKGKKLFKLSIDEESPTSSELFSQSENKVLMRDYENFIAQVEEQKRRCEERKKESQKILSSLSSRREEVETRWKANKLQLKRLLDKFQILQQMVQQQRKKCREDEDLLMTLLRDEARVMVEQDGYHEKLFSFNRRLLALRAAAEDP